ncbi:unnamed protein product [Cuscuta epithymum]|uniref:Uncharacterized protein n=1 Tax=Cuscuta epithymum TaxID=186058 RepID=A0AAV0GEH1_9ASTE|nr:unnamed protein product [Cuscuta epithymum]
MLRHVRVHATRDLQMALENNIRKANLTKPLLYGPELEKYPPFLIFDELVTIVYLNHEGEKRLMRIDEIAKYCNGTLKIIRDKIKQKKDDIERRLADASEAEI